MATFVLVGYFSILLLLCVFGMHRLYLVRLFQRHVTRDRKPDKTFDVLPAITVQLPIFNEKYVVRRLIQACAELDYPFDKLQIQVLDDSTDETVEIAAAECREWAAKGIDIVHIHRTNRVGFKAGALAAGLRCAKGSLLAVFDADFVPPPNFLLNCVHYFTDPQIGMVQARWDHLNRELSTLTRVQAVMLDAHFMIEHAARCDSGLFFNFNGTAGLWRKQTIEDAGGWQHDTLTEDLDLSYRAQLAGWRFRFLPDVTCPAELPIDVSAFKSQQHRWAKGSVQVWLKLMGSILSSKLPFRVKLEAMFHLGGNFAYLLMLANTVLFVIPSMLVRQDWDWWWFLLVDGPIFCLASLSFIYFYLASQKAVFGHIKGRKALMPALMAVGLGMGVNNARAVIEALLGKQSEFVRTPKTGSAGSGSVAKRRGYRLPKSGWGYVEIAIGFAYSLTILWLIPKGMWGPMPFLVLFQNGFLFIGLHTILDHTLGRKQDIQKPMDPDFNAA